MSRVVRGDIAMKDAPILTKYFPQALVEGAEVPKFMLFSGHSRSMEPLLDLFSVPEVTNPPSGSSLWINFYETQWGTGPERFVTEVVYCPDPRDFTSCETLTFDKYYQKKGLMKNLDFERWLQGNINDYVMQRVDITTKEIEDICAVNFTYDPIMKPFRNPEQFYMDLLREFGLSPGDNDD